MKQRVICFHGLEGLQNSAAVGILTPHLYSSFRVKHTKSAWGLGPTHSHCSYTCDDCRLANVLRRIVAFQVKILQVSFQAKGHLYHSE